MYGSEIDLILSNVSTSSSKPTINILNYRKKIKDFLNLDSCESALFLADILLEITKLPEDIYSASKCLFAMKKYQNAISIIKCSGAADTDLHCRYMMAKCMYENKDYSDALSILNNENLNPKNRSLVVFPNEADKMSRRSGTNSSLNKLYSVIFLLKARILDALENRKRSAVCYKRALQYNLFCYSAVETLINYNINPNTELVNFLISFPNGEKDEIRFAIKVYLMIINADKHSHYCSLLLKPLKNSADILLSEAQRYYNFFNYTKCYEITSAVLKKRLLNIKYLPLHTSCLIELGAINKLFYLAHDLIDKYPNEAISWYVVGCYYFTIGKQETARRYFSKSLYKNPSFGMGWLTYGHSFASDNEHDQAMSAYIKANELMTKNNLALLYIALECGFHNNIDTASKFLKDALKSAPRDPFVLHEMGVVAYQTQKYDDAENYCLQAFIIVKSLDPSFYSSKWEPLLNNLGHISRKLKQYDKALEYFQEALLLIPLNPTTLSNIGFIHAINSNYTEAMDYLHMSLGIKTKHSFSVALVNQLIEKVREEPPSNFIVEFGKIVEIPNFQKNISVLDLLIKKMSDDEPPAVLDIKMEDTTTEDNISSDLDDADDSDSESLYDP